MGDRNEQFDYETFLKRFLQYALFGTGTGILLNYLLKRYPDLVKTKFEKIKYSPFAESPEVSQVLKKKSSYLNAPNSFEKRAEGLLPKVLLTTVPFAATLGSYYLTDYIRKKMVARKLRKDTERLKKLYEKELKKRQQKMKEGQEPSEMKTAHEKRAQNLNLSTQNMIQLGLLSLFPISALIAWKYSLAHPTKSDKELEALKKIVLLQKELFD